VSEAFRGFVLLFSVVLWSPCLMPLIAGEMTVAEAGVRYAIALLLAWGGSAAVVALWKAYAPEAEEEEEEVPDAAPVPDRAPAVETAQAEVLVERRKQPRDDDAVAT
jgi:hypothetical protein